MHNMRYARIDTAKGTIEEFRDFDERPVDIPHKNVQWLPAPQSERPNFDPARQVLEGPDYTIVADAVIEVWRVRDKTGSELASDLDVKIARVDEVTRAAIADLDKRLTALEGRQSRGVFSFLRGLFGG